MQWCSADEWAMHSAAARKLGLALGTALQIVPEHLQWMEGTSFGE
jgi:hypothetical protein